MWPKYNACGCVSPCFCLSVCLSVSLSVSLSLSVRVCVYVCVRACVRACMRACLSVCVYLLLFSQQGLHVYNHSGRTRKEVKGGCVGVRVGMKRGLEDGGSGAVGRWGGRGGRKTL